MTSPTARPPRDFIRQIVEADLHAGKHAGKVVTRFPPEPNGYLHIGHAKSICLNFGVALDYGGRCHLRFDDTNPARESPEYVAAIKRDVRWLGYDWGEHLRHASDYFEALYGHAVELIRRRLAYVCSLSPDAIREHRGTLTEPGRDSPYRDRSVAENLDLFARMRAGEFAEGEHVLRARIDMASPNLNLRDPVLYRILHARHAQTGDAWCIYPLYDFTHCLCDSIEGITHSLCTLEFEDHRALYDWILDVLEVPCHPQQIEFSRLNLAFTVMSKRRLARLVEGGHVAGWDDPRMPTIGGLRRRGYTPESIREFCARIGVTRKENTVEMSALESCAREDLDARAPRAMAVLRPLKLVIDNYPAGRVEELEARNHPHRPELGSRRIPFSRELWIERDDFMADPPRKYHRLAPGREVRLRYGYLVRCERYLTDASGAVVEVHCTYDPETRGGQAPDGRKVRGTIHWVSAAHALRARVNLYDRLFTHPEPGALGAEGFLDALNPDSLVTLDDCVVEPALGAAEPGARFQFERLGYFCVDPGEAAAGAPGPVFNRTVTLRDSWAKAQRETGRGSSLDS